jgi:hypothetical protein
VWPDEEPGDSYNPNSEGPAEEHPGVFDEEQPHEPDEQPWNVHDLGYEEQPHEPDEQPWNVHDLGSAWREDSEQPGEHVEQPGRASNSGVWVEASEQPGPHARPH